MYRLFHRGPIYGCRTYVKLGRPSYDLFFRFVRPWGMQIPQRSFIGGHIGQYEKFFPISRNSDLWFNIIVVGGISLNKVNALQTGRFYKVKNPQRNFLCALCSAPRQMKYSKNLSMNNFFQILVLSVSISTACYPLMGMDSLFLVFPVWMIAEIINKMLYRKGISCPYCGFDATWYRRDVNMANQKVKSFWQENYPELVKKPLSLSVDDTVPAQSVPDDEQKQYEAQGQL